MDIGKRLRAMHPKCNVDELYQKYKKELDDLEMSSYPEKPDKEEFNRLVGLINERCEALGEPSGRKRTFEDLYGTEEACKAEETFKVEVFPKPKAFDEKKMLSMGRLWEKNGKKRIYFNALDILFDVEYYKTGNVKKAAWKDSGVEISNGKAFWISFSKLYYDYSTDSLEGDLGKDYKDMAAAILV